MTGLVGSTLSISALLPPKISSKISFSSLPVRLHLPTSFPHFFASGSSESSVNLSQPVSYDTPLPAADVVKSFYGGINRRDLSSVVELIAENCVYEDLVYPRPFVGRKEVLNFFEKFMNSISPDLQFVIDDISTEDTMAVGVSWHLEWKGKEFPFSKGCSFYRLQVVEGNRQIIYGRDSVEGALKPGDSALAVIRGVTWLLNRLPFLVERL